jgi:hypothetical protein
LLRHLDPCHCIRRIETKDGSSKVRLMRFIDIDQSASFISLDRRAGFCSFHQTMTIDSLFASIVATQSLDHQMVVLHFLRITGMPISYLVGPETNSEKNDLADGGPEPISASCNAVTSGA